MKYVMCALICSLFLLNQCGIPSEETYDDLNAPKNLTVTDSSGDANIVISFWAYNPENNFTGYNIYMATSSEADLRAQHAIHIQNNEVNTTVETNYIVKSTAINYPTIQDGDGVGVSTARTTPTQITYTISKGPNESTLLGVPYYIGISAISTTNNVESGLSNVITATK